MLFMLTRDTATLLRKNTKLQNDRAFLYAAVMAWTTTWKKF